MSSATVRHEPPPRQSAPVSALALWASILAGPLAVLGNLQLSYMMVSWVCQYGYPWMLHLASFAFAALAAGGAALGWRNWRQAGGEWPSEDEGATPRSRFLGALGVIGGAFFFAVVLAEWVPVFVLGPCQRA